MEEYIYLIMSQTGTQPARFFRFFTRKPYNHVSLSGDITLSEMYSFCRTYTPFPLPATFNKEIIGEGTFGQYGFIPCEIYRIPVTKEQKEMYNRVINHFSQNRNIYSYNVLGLLAVYLNIEWKRKKALSVHSLSHTLWIKSAYTLTNRSVFTNPTTSGVFRVQPLFIRENSINSTTPCSHIFSDTEIRYAINLMSSGASR